MQILRDSVKCVLPLDLRIQHCDRAHPEVHQISKDHVQMHLCAEEMHGFCQESAYFVFDLTFLQTLDGRCLLDSLCFDPLQHGYRVWKGWQMLMFQMSVAKESVEVYTWSGGWLVMNLIERSLGLHTGMLYTGLSEERVMLSQHRQPQWQHTDCCVHVVPG